ncbi:hypothetical protein BDQ17DRAFT_1539513 [Cyathus striatus]|nr:hypothetical protein BDQ17DRAFT_1539513 [Cyathus striatus]
MFNSFKLVALVALISTTALGAPSPIEGRDNALDANERRQFPGFPSFSGLPSGGASGFPAFPTGGFPGFTFPFPSQAAGTPAATPSAGNSTAIPSAESSTAAAPSASAVDDTSAAVPTAAAPSAGAVDDTD